MHDPGARRHHLDVAGLGPALVAELVAVGDGAFPHIGDDFHVAVRVRVEAAAGTDGVVVPDPERADTHPLRIVVVAEAEVMAGGQPVDVEPDETAERTYLDHCRSDRKNTRLNSSH